MRRRAEQLRGRRARLRRCVVGAVAALSLGGLLQGCGGGVAGNNCDPEIFADCVTVNADVIYQLAESYPEGADITNHPTYCGVVQQLMECYKLEDCCVVDGVYMAPMTAKYTQTGNAWCKEPDKVIVDPCVGQGRPLDEMDNPPSPAPAPGEAPTEEPRVPAGPARCPPPGEASCSFVGEEAMCENDIPAVCTDGTAPACEAAE